MFVSHRCFITQTPKRCTKWNVLNISCFSVLIKLRRGQSQVMSIIDIEERSSSSDVNYWHWGEVKLKWCQLLTLRRGQAEVMSIIDIHMRLHIWDWTIRPTNVYTYCTYLYNLYNFISLDSNFWYRYLDINIYEIMLYIFKTIIVKIVRLETIKNQHRFYFFRCNLYSKLQKYLRPQWKYKNTRKKHL